KSGRIDQGDLQMKSFLLAIAITLMLASSLWAGTNPVLATSQPQTVFVGVGFSQTPLCSPGDLCAGNQFGLPQTDGAPISSCDPGKKCDRVDDQLQLRASDGAPIPSCDPGKKCDRVDDQLQLRASDGAPIPSCDPGKKCDRVDDQLQLRASDGAPIPSCDSANYYKSDLMDITMVVSRPLPV